MADSRPKIKTVHSPTSRKLSPSIPLKNAHHQKKVQSRSALEATKVPLISTRKESIMNTAGSSPSRCWRVSKNHQWIFRIKCSQLLWFVKKAAECQPRRKMRDLFWKELIIKKRRSLFLRSWLTKWVWLRIVWTWRKIWWAWTAAISSRWSQPWRKYGTSAKKAWSPRKNWSNFWRTGIRLLSFTKKRIDQMSSLRTKATKTAGKVSKGTMKRAPSKN